MESSTKAAPIDGLPLNCMSECSAGAAADRGAEIAAPEPAGRRLMFAFVELAKAI
jgi:hypothetical protein